MKLAIHLVTWNGGKYIPFLFESLRKQTFLDWRIDILDNASSDDTATALEMELKHFSFPHTLRRNETNIGFAEGHNFLWCQSASDYVMLLNQDMYLEPRCLEKLVDFMDNHNDAIAVSPRLMRWNFSRGEFTAFVDSLGLTVSRNRRVTERGAGTRWTGVPGAAAEEVFGVSGALPLLRRAALPTVAFSAGLIFDQNYGSYKEDVDLAYRLRSAGYRSFVVLDAVAYHDRTAIGAASRSDFAAMKNKTTQSSAIRYCSYKNHLLTLYKNEYWQNFWLDFPWIFWYEVRKFCWFLCFDRVVLRGWLDIWRQRSELRQKRHWIAKNRQVDWRTLRRWWS